MSYCERWGLNSHHCTKMKGPDAISILNWTLFFSFVYPLASSPLCTISHLRFYYNFVFKNDFSKSFFCLVMRVIVLAIFSWSWLLKVFLCFSFKFFDCIKFWPLVEQACANLVRFPWTPHLRLDHLKWNQPHFFYNLIEKTEKFERQLCMNCVQWIGRE